MGSDARLGMRHFERKNHPADCAHDQSACQSLTSLGTGIYIRIFKATFNSPTLRGTLYR